MSGPDAVTPESPGRILRSAREAHGLSRREIADALNLLESVVVAIEEDDIARQPELVFMRGYVRNYARLLKLDPEPLVSGLSSGRVPPPVRHVQTISESPRWIWPAVGVAVAVAVLVAVVASLLQADPDAPAAGVAGIAATAAGRQDHSPRPADSAATVQSPIMADAEGLPAAEGTRMPDTLIEIDHDDGAEDGTDPGESVEVSGQADPAPGAPGGDPVITGTTGTMQAAVTVATIDMPTVKKRRLNPGSGDTILLHFTNDCWVRVKDSTGRMLFSDMGRAGGGLELIGTGPFDVLLGFAPGATLNWNGSEVALAPHMRNNVATILLDRDASGSGSDG